MRDTQTSMPPRDLPFGSDTLTVPCYLSTGPDDPGFAAWKSEHPDWFEAGTWTPAPQRRHGQRNDAEREKLVAWMNETRTLERASLRPGGDADWTVSALRSATFPIGLPGPGEHDWFQGKARYVSIATARSDDDFTLYPPDPNSQPARVERVSEKVDPITARIRDVDSQLHILLATTFRERAAAIDRSGSAANFGTRLHTLRDLVNTAAIPGVQAEQSFAGGDAVEYGTAGSVRTDILLRIGDDVVAVWDFKTGQAPKLPEPRKQQIRSAIRSQYRIRTFPSRFCMRDFTGGDVEVSSNPQGIQRTFAESASAPKRQSLRGVANLLRAGNRR